MTFYSRTTLISFLFGLALSGLMADSNQNLDDLRQQKRLLEEQIKNLEKENQATAFSDDPALDSEVVVTAYRRDTPLEAVGKSVTVITSSDMQKRGVTEVLEALREAEGLSIVQTGTKGGATSIFTRGGESNFTAVMIDGVKINGDGGFIDIGHIMADGFERIEVVRGPGSSLYGADAISGVVNLITKRGRGAPTLELSSEVGSFGTFIERATLSGSTAQADYLFSINYFEQQNGRWENDDYRNTTQTANFGFRPSDQLELRFLSRSVKDQLGAYTSVGSFAGPVLDLQTDPNDEIEDDTQLFATQAIFTPSERFEGRLKISRFDQDTNTITKPDFFSSDSSSVSVSEFERQSIELQGIWDLSDQHVITLGLSGDNEKDPDADDKRDNLAIYLQDSMNWDDQLYFNVSGRIDKNTSFGTELTGNSSLAWHLNDQGTQLKASAGTGIKAPSFIEINGFGAFGIGLKDSIGTVNLEKSSSWDVGLVQEFSETLKFGVTFFSSRFRNIVEYVSATLSYGQGAKARAQGTEWTLKYQPNEVLALRAQWTNMMTRVQQTNTTSLNFEVGNHLIRRPNNFGSASLDVKASDELNLNLHLTHRGDTDDRDFTGRIGNGRVDNSRYTRWDAGLVYRPHLISGLKIFSHLENLTDEDYQEVFGYPAEKFNMRAGASYQIKF